MAQTIDSILCTILEARTSKSKVTTNLVADEDSLPNLQKENKLSGVSSFKGTDPIVGYEGPQLLPKGLISNTITWGAEASTSEFGWDRGHTFSGI